jgi:hypothetical protein
MKKLLLFLILTPLLSFSQLIINQVVLEPAPYKVGDTITIQYFVQNQNLDVNYLWFRYHYSNKHLEIVPNSTTFHQGASSQTFYTHWSNFDYNYNSSIAVGDLYSQFRNGMTYSQSPNWNVAQISLQRTDAPISGLVASQKYILKDNTSYVQIHKLHSASATRRNGSVITSIGSSVLWLDIKDVSRLVSSVKFKVAFPSGYDITKHTIQVVPTNSQGVVDWSTNPQPVAVGYLDSSGEFLTDKLQKNKQYQVKINPASGQNLPSNIITVTDAYKAFKAINDRGINNSNPYFETDLETNIANVTQDLNFDSQDSYYIFATVMGVDLSSVSDILLPTKDITKPVKFLSGFTNGFSSSTSNSSFTPVLDNETYDLSYAWAGDLDFSHSSPLVVSSNVSGTSKLSAKTQISLNENTTIKTEIISGKVIVSVGLDVNDLAGAEYKIGYDDSKLSFEDVSFDTGNSIVNFSTHSQNIITFGSIDKQGVTTIKKGVPYKLTFKPKSPLTNTTGLIFTYFSEAVNLKANRVILKVK